MQRILLSALVVGGVVGAAVYGTTAFFSDTETSVNNTFTAGALDLKIDSQAHYNGMVCNEAGVWVEEATGSAVIAGLIGQPCEGTWTETDLTDETFFSFADLKPGDWGENTISMHVEDNDAYVCAAVHDMSNDDNGLTEPEGEDGDVTDGPDNGELAQELRFFAWAESDGDNVWESGEASLFSNDEGPASDVLDGVVYPLFTPATVGPLAGDTTQYLGLYWCYGDIGIDDVNFTLTCNGEPVNNVSQTDIVNASLSFYTEQARNNEDFTCPGIENFEQEV